MRTPQLVALYLAFFVAGWFSGSLLRAQASATPACHHVQCEEGSLLRWTFDRCDVMAGGRVVARFSMHNAQGAYDFIKRNDLPACPAGVAQ